MNPVLATLLETEPKKSLFRAFGMWVTVSAVGVILFFILVGTLANRRIRRARALNPRAKRRRRTIPDAWAEAGRRAEPIRMDEPEPPTAEEPGDSQP